MGDSEKNEALIDAPSGDKQPPASSGGFSLSMLLPSKSGWSWASGEPLLQFISMGSFLICFSVMICGFILIGGSAGIGSGPMPANNWTLSPSNDKMPCLSFDVSQSVACRFSTGFHPRPSLDLKLCGVQACDAARYGMPILPLRLG